VTALRRAGSAAFLPSTFAKKRDKSAHILVVGLVSRVTVEDRAFN
jgi:hypothetical protein